MNVLHICISNFYIDNYSYQENILPIINLRDGHVVKIIASTEIFLEGKQLGYINPSEYYSSEGIPVVRIPYSNLLPSKIMKKVRIYKFLKREIIHFRPDIIIFHGTAAFDIVKVANYIKRNPETKFFVDCHEAFYNSARNWASRYILHGIIYKYSFLKALPFIDKVYYIGMGEKEYLKSIYKLSDKRMDLFPLGDISVDESDYLSQRMHRRNELGILNNEIVFVHSGKLAYKNKTLEIVKSFLEAKQENSRLLIIGDLTEELSRKVIPIINQNTPKIIFLGWKDSKELKEYLCGADVYVQFSVSATFQSALLRRCYGITTNPNKTYGYFPPDLCTFIQDENDLKREFVRLGQNVSDLENKRKISYEWANKNLNYEELMRTKIYNF